MKAYLRQLDRHQGDEVGMAESSLWELKRIVISDAGL